MLVLTWRKCWIKNIDVHANVDFRVSNTLLYLRYYACGADLIQVACFNGGKAAANIVSHVAFPTNEWCSYTGVDRGIANEPLVIIISNLYVPLLEHRLQPTSSCAICRKVP